MANATVNNNVYTLVNDLMKEVLGTKAIAVHDTSSFISAGKAITGTDDTALIESFYNAFYARIAKLAWVTKRFNPSIDSVMVDASDWGYYYNRYRAEFIDAEENDDFKKSNSPTERPSNPSEYVAKNNIKGKTFYGQATWEYNDVIYDEVQLALAFSSESEFNGFVTLKYTAMYNSYDMALFNTSNLARGKYIELASPRRVKLITLYNTLFTPTENVTVANYATNKEFLKWAYQKIKTTLNLMYQPSKLYNDGSVTEWIERGDERFHIITDFAEAFKSTVLATDYHNDLESLPQYNEVAYWVGRGTTDAFDDRSKVVYKDAEGEDAIINNIVCVINNKDAVVMSANKKRFVTEYQPLNTRSVIAGKAVIGYLVDNASVGTVFTLE